MAQYRIEPVGDPDVLEPLLREYVRWCLEEMVAKNGVRFDDLDEVVERHQQAFDAEVPHLLRPPGRFLFARIGPEPVGVGALAPIDAVTAEIKRMYVRPEAQGRGIGRGLLERLIADARAEGFRRLRLETANFMVAAHALYRSLGFRDAPSFDDAETAATVEVDGFIYFMELSLDEGGTRR